MKRSQYVVDAFVTDRPFSGNPAAVVPLDAWPDDALMQSIARQNNLSETAFFVPDGDGYALRWFTPANEVDLCGHATLASAFVISRFTEPGTNTIRFGSRSGPLTVRFNGDTGTMDFPADPGERIECSERVARGLGATPDAVYKAMYYMAVFESEAQVAALTPDFRALGDIDCVGVIATAPGDQCDFVSRFFAPREGIDEDPVTGSAHCILTPFWAARLDKSAMHARQISARGGDIHCELAGDRVRLTGRARLYLDGTISC